jgi:aspartate-semialdehyde dehydrogenase
MTNFEISAGRVTGLTQRQLLRMRDDTVIILDPVNDSVIQAQALTSGIRSFAGGNCTVSLMLMAAKPRIVSTKDLHRMDERA